MTTKTINLLLAIFICLASASFAAPSKPKPSKPDETQLFEKGTKMLFNEKYGAAEKALRSAVAADNEYAEAHNNLAFVLRKQGEANYEEALKHYNRALALDEDLAEAYMYRGVLHLAMGHKDLALGDHQKLIELSEDDLASELEWVVENGKEKTPARFFGVVPMR